MSPLIAPSLLSADFSAAGLGLQKIEAAGADWVHLDVMDGSFVPEITFGVKMIRDLRPLSSLPFDVHLMIVSPERHVAGFAAAGADYLTVHAEAALHLHRCLTEIRAAGAHPGVSIVPSSPVAMIREVLDAVDLVLVMTVNPGFGGQSLIPRTLDKVAELCRLREHEGLDFRIQVDGGINTKTAPRAAAAGADVLVTGTSFFTAESPRDYVGSLRGANVKLEGDPVEE